MGYERTNAAYAYDLEATQEAFAPQAPQLDVYAGAGTAANQEVSPVFTHVLKVACVLVALVFVVGVVRVTLASATTATLNASASTYESLEASRTAGKDLEIMNSVYGSDSRIRDIAVNSLGMVEADETVTLDFAEPAADAS